MALKAGYYGVKKQILDELKKLDGILPAGVSKTNKLATETEIIDLWKGNGIEGSKNFLVNNAVTATNHDVTFTVNADKSITANGQNDGDENSTIILNSSLTLKAGSYILSGGVSDMFYITLYKATSPYTTYAKAQGVDVPFTLEEDTAVSIIAVVKKGQTADNVAYYPMLRLGIDKDDKYQPYAQTNQQLTASVTTLEGSASDQKTAINAIISAATGAADFAAFKTAMGAITPVTRSIPVIPEEDPELETRTTKKSTKKTTE